MRDRFAWGLDGRDPAARPARPGSRCSGGSPPSAVDQLPEPDVLREIATRVPGNLRRLEGALTRVLAFSSVFGEPPPAPRSVRALPLERPRRRARAQRRHRSDRRLAIQGAVCLRPRRPPGRHALGASARPRVARARQLAMYLARELTALSLAEIAREFDRDHSTVLHAIRAVEQRNEPGSDARRTISTASAQRLGATRPARPVTAPPPVPTRPGPPQPSSTPRPAPSHSRRTGVLHTLPRP